MPRKSPDAPEPLLLERRIESGDDVHADRVTTDGTLWQATSVDARLEGGEWSFGRAEPAWERGATLGPEALGRLRDAIIRSGLLTTATDVGATNIKGGAQEVWTADLDGFRHTVTLHGRGTVDVPALTALADALADAKDI